MSGNALLDAAAAGDLIGIAKAVRDGSLTSQHWTLAQALLPLDSGLHEAVEVFRSKHALAHSENPDEVMLTRPHDQVSSLIANKLYYLQISIVIHPRFILVVNGSEQSMKQAQFTALVKQVLRQDQRVARWVQQVRDKIDHYSGRSAVEIDLKDSAVATLDQSVVSPPPKTRVRPRIEDRPSRKAIERQRYLRELQDHESPVKKMTRYVPKRHPVEPPSRRIELMRHGQHIEYDPRFGRVVPGKTFQIQLGGTDPSTRPPEGPIVRLLKRPNEL